MHWFCVVNVSNHGSKASVNAPILSHWILSSEHFLLLSRKHHQPSGPKAGSFPNFPYISPQSCNMLQPSLPVVFGSQFIKKMLAPDKRWTGDFLLGCVDLCKFWYLFQIPPVHSCLMFFHSLVLEHDAWKSRDFLYWYIVKIWRYTYMKQNHVGGNKLRLQLWNGNIIDLCSLSGYSVTTKTTAIQELKQVLSAPLLNFF